MPGLPAADGKDRPRRGSVSGYPAPSPASIPKEKQSHYDTLVQFAAVEWEARIQKH
jgi:hypothetical protein